MSMLKHNIQSILLGCILALLLLIPFSAVSEEYGPTQRAESLWNIAKSIPHNEAVSTTQLMHAIYKLNPDAFHSSNMNELKKDIYLQLPDDMEAVSQLSYKDARKEYRVHLQNLELLQISAKDLSNAKKHYSRWSRKYKSLRKQLETTNTLSRTANARISARLKTATAKQIKWKKEVRQLRKALLKKAALQQSTSTEITEELASPAVTATAKQEKEATRINLPQANQNIDSKKAVPQNTRTKREATDAGQENVRSKSTVTRIAVEPYSLKASQENIDLELKLQDLETKIEKTQSSLRAKSANQDLLIFKLQNELKASQQILQKKLAAQERMEGRLTVLENELGSKEQVILKLQSTLRTAADTMKQQQVENEKLRVRLQTLETNKSTTTQTKRFEILGSQQSQILTSETNNNKKAKNVNPANNIPASNTENINNIGVLQYAISFILTAIILVFLAYKLYEANRKRKFKKRMEVIELKLKPVNTGQKAADNPFSKNKYKSDNFGYRQPRTRL